MKGKHVSLVMAILGGLTMIALAFLTQRPAFDCVLVGGGVGAMGGGVAANIFMDKIVALRTGQPTASAGSRPDTQREG